MNTTISQLTSLASAFAYVAGMWLIVLGIKELKSVGEKRQDGSSVGLGNQLFLILAGILLLNLPAFLLTMTNTLFLNTSQLSYVFQENYNDIVNSHYIQTLISIIELIGLISIIRGIFLLTDPSHQNQEGRTNFNRAVVHIIGGTLCININICVIVILNTLFS